MCSREGMVIRNDHEGTCKRISRIGAVASGETERTAHGNEARNRFGKTMEDRKANCKARANANTHKKDCRFA